MTDFSHCSPIAYLYGLWSVTFMGRKPFDDLLNNKEINLTSLDFLLTEADYQTDTSTMEQFVFSPLSYYLYENGLLDKSKLKPITTLTINDLYITKKQINRIYNNKGKALPRIMTTEDESKYIKEKNMHPTQKKALEDRMEIRKAINKLLAIYPSNPKDEDTCYRTKNGKLIKAKIADVLNNHQATLFDSGKLPLRDHDTLLDAIGEYLKELGWNSDR